MVINNYQLVLIKIFERQKIMKRILATLLFITTCSAFADVPASIESQVRAMLPNTKITKINYAPYPGIYEVLAGDNAFYLGLDNESEIIVGHIINVKNMQDETQNHIEQANAKRFDFKSLPLDLALKVGKGKKQMLVVIDPDCPYCQQLEAYLHSNQDKLTIYYLFMPLPMHPNAVPHTKQILCSNNPSKALFDIMVNRQELAAGSASCQSKVEKQLISIADFTRNNGINSTPYIITDTNQVIGGFNVPAIQNFMEAK